MERDCAARSFEAGNGAWAAWSLSGPEPAVRNVVAMRRHTVALRRDNHPVTPAGGVYVSTADAGPPAIRSCLLVGQPVPEHPLGGVLVEFVPGRRALVAFRYGSCGDVRWWTVPAGMVDGLGETAPGAAGARGHGVIGNGAELQRLARAAQVGEDGVEPVRRGQRGDRREQVGHAVGGEIGRDRTGRPDGQVRVQPVDQRVVAELA
jgi:hypothetical protein